jgi:hypothetical protein
MKVVAYYALHYGSEWLKWSIESVRNHVDDIIVVYAPGPSFGHGTKAVCPDTKEELMEICRPYDVLWSNISKSHWEGNHRDAAVSMCMEEGADIIMPVDHDELWDPVMLSKSLDFVKSSPQKHYLVHMQHYWRSVDYVCFDMAAPQRFIKPGAGSNITSYIPSQYGNVHHYGYAQSVELMRYKWLIHGHLGELRPDWLDKIFIPWKPGMRDVHPTNEKNFWDPVPFDKLQLEHLIGDHPYYHLDLIP